MKLRITLTPKFMSRMHGLFLEPFFFAFLPAFLSFLKNGIAGAASSASRPVAAAAGVGAAAGQPMLLLPVCNRWYSEVQHNSVTKQSDSCSVSAARYDDDDKNQPMNSTTCGCRSRFSNATSRTKSPFSWVSLTSLLTWFCKFPSFRFNRFTATSVSRHFAL